MKYLVSLLLALPLINSCTVIQEEYYEPGYYNPPPRVEVVPDYDNRHYHDNRRGGYRPAPQGRVYHGHNNMAPGPVIINPGAPQIRPGNQVPVQPNVHGHPGPAQPNVHGHQGSAQVPAQPNVHGHQGSAQVPAQPNVHGHQGSTQVPAQPNVQGHAEEQKKVHGHDDSKDVIPVPPSGIPGKGQQNTHGH